MESNDQDLNECDKEPIHIPSAIQPNGFFLAVDSKDRNILAVSDNIDLYFAFTTEHILSQALSFFSPLLDTWVNGLTFINDYESKIFTFEHSYAKTPFIVSVHQQNSTLILEAEPAMETDLFPDLLAKSLMNETLLLTRASSIDELCHLGTIALQRLSGFGRVMVYQFDENFNGCVSAEANTPPMESYLNHHFPAGDIPAQARELYRTNLIRYIPQSTYTPIPVKSIPAEPINMSQSILRSVSPIHLEYLRNMNVDSSMSLSIVVNGELWGLFACHHPEPIALSYTTRHYCGMLIRFFNALLQEKLANESSKIFFRLKDRYTTLKEAFQTLVSQSDIHDAFVALGQSWLDAMESDGVSLLQNNHTSVFGTVPSHAQIIELSTLIDPFHENDLFVSHTLGDIFSFDGISGIMSLIISHNPRTEIIWFRREWVQKLKWAGDPNKATIIDHSQRISPRKSFETLIIEQRGKSLPWSTSHLLAVHSYKEFGSIVELDHATRSLKQQNILLIQQGKMAMMGEMIGAIAHQWQQPLNALSILIDSLTMSISECENHSKSVTEIKQKSMDKIAFMSKTLDAFRNFFKPDSLQNSFSIMKVIRDTNDQLLPQLKINQVQLRLDDNPARIQGSSIEFQQIILNLLVNAHDALMEKNVQEPYIHCSIEQTDTNILLHIDDNGGGIPQEHLESIFSQYFSTKANSAGRGIGLYIAKLIMEEHFGGSINVSNTPDGVRFTLTFVSND